MGRQEGELARTPGPLPPSLGLPPPQRCCAYGRLSPSRPETFGDWKGHVPSWRKWGRVALMISVLVHPWVPEPVTGCGLEGVPASGRAQVTWVSCARFSSAASSNVRYEKCLELSGELPREPREKVRSRLARPFFPPVGSDTGKRAFTILKIQERLRNLSWTIRHFFFLSRWDF